MSTLYTQCPGCNTTFRINAKKLKAARGEVMCQNCHIIFNALNSLSSTVKEAVNDRNVVHGPAPSTTVEIDGLRRVRRALTQEAPVHLSSPRDPA